MNEGNGISNIIKEYTNVIFEKLKFNFDNVGSNEHSNSFPL